MKKDVPEQVEVPIERGLSPDELAVLRARRLALVEYWNAMFPRNRLIFPDDPPEDDDIADSD